MQNLVDTHSTMIISSTLDSEILLPLLSKLNNNLTVMILTHSDCQVWANSVDPEGAV